MDASSGLRGNERAQSIQIGAVLLFGIVIVSFSIYQATIVPDQNKQVEFKLTDEIEGDMKELRTSILRSSTTGFAEPVSVRLGGQYPNRALAVNPPPPSGTLRTIDAKAEVSIDNAVATGEAGDFWNGELRPYSTKFLQYQPTFNEYRQAPRFTYENSVLYANHSNGGVQAQTGQTLISGNRISLVLPSGKLSRSRSGVYSTDFSTLSVSSTELPIEGTDDGEPITIKTPSRMPKSSWEDLLATEMDTSEEDEKYVESFECTNEPPTPCGTLTITLEQGQSYSLKMSKIGIGTSTEQPDTEYIVLSEALENTIKQGTTHQLTVETRDGLNNPVGNVEISAEADLGEIETSPTTNADGSLTLTYEAPNVNANTEDTIKITADGAASSAAEDQPLDIVRSVTVEAPTSEQNNKAGLNADFSYDIGENEETITFDGTKSSTPAEQITSYRWKFEYQFIVSFLGDIDRGVDTEVVTDDSSPARDFDSDEFPVAVTLSVTDNTGSTDSVTQMITEDDIDEAQQGEGNDGPGNGRGPPDDPGSGRGPR